MTEAVSADSAEDVTVLVVDDQPPNLRLMDAVLSPRGYKVIAVESGQKALTALKESPIDVVLLDIVMPGMDGHEVCRQIRADEATAFLPVVMITASGPQEKLHALESGADDFITKPFDQAELIARVASLSKVKRYHDTIRRQAEELAAWNRELEQRVDSQVAELQRVEPATALPCAAGRQLGPRSWGRVVLESHRREIVVVFCDLRGFTRFAESSEPEEVMEVLTNTMPLSATWFSGSRAPWSTSPATG